MADRRTMEDRRLQVKKYEQYKRLIRFLAGVSLIAAESIIFMYMWIYCYKDQMEMPYQRLGNYALAAVYALKHRSD